MEAKFPLNTRLSMMIEDLWGLVELSLEHCRDKGPLIRTGVANLVNTISSRLLTAQS